MISDCLDHAAETSDNFRATFAHSFTLHQIGLEALYPEVAKRPTLGVYKIEDLAEPLHEQIFVILAAHG